VTDKLPPASHTHDPSTSHDAEREHTESGARQRHLETVFELVLNYPDRTASELASIGPYDLQETRRRLTDLMHLGRVRQCDARIADGRSKREVTWRICDDGEPVAKATKVEPTAIVDAVRKLLDDHRVYAAREGRVCIDVDVSAFVRLVTLMAQDGVSR
jgi:hypothetical protein